MRLMSIKIPPFYGGRYILVDRSFLVNICFTMMTHCFDLDAMVTVKVHLAHNELSLPERGNHRIVINLLASHEVP